MMGALPVVNGQTGRMLVIVAGVSMVVVIIAMSVLAILAKPIPPELGTVLFGLLTFIIGSRVSPPDVTQTILDTHAPSKPAEPPANGDA